LTLKLAELAAIREARGAHPILLLDDVSSELDPTRIGAVFGFLNASSSQVFVTTTRPELFQTPGAGRSDRCDYVLCGGALRAASEGAPEAALEGSREASEGPSTLP
jgi:DNA replication and repair protein RecF